MTAPPPPVVVRARMWPALAGLGMLVGCLVAGLLIPVHVRLTGTVTAIDRDSATALLNPGQRGDLAGRPVTLARAQRSGHVTAVGTDGSAVVIKVQLAPGPVAARDGDRVVVDLGSHSLITDILG